MAFSSGSSSSLTASPNITPLIDVLLVLLIIFMVIVPVSPHGLETLIPQNATSPLPDSTPVPILLRVAPQGSARGVSYTLADRPLKNADLTAALARIHAWDVRRAILIDGDASLDFQAVAAAVAAAKIAGFQSIGLVPRGQHHF